MPEKKPAPFKRNGRLAFFQEFLKHPLQIGSIIPSSRFLEQRILKSAAISSASTVVELGSGTGGITKALLGAMPPQSRLLSIEINSYFHSLIHGIRDDRLIAHLGDAFDLETILAMYELDQPTAIISGIPFSTMSYTAGSKLLKAISTRLAPDGHFVAYQVSSRVASLSRPYMGVEQMKVELLNIPPMRVYQWAKRAAR